MLNFVRFRPEWNISAFLMMLLLNFFINGLLFRDLSAKAMLTFSSLLVPVFAFATLCVASRDLVNFNSYWTCYLALLLAIPLVGGIATRKKSFIASLFVTIAIFVLMVGYTTMDMARKQGLAVNLKAAGPIAAALFALAIAVAISLAKCGFTLPGLSSFLSKIDSGKGAPLLK